MASTKSIYNKQSLQCYKNCNYFCFSLWNLLFPCSFLKGIVKWVKPCKWVILLISRILTLENQPFFKRQYSLATFGRNFSFPVYTAPFQWRLLIYIRKNLWHRVLEANKKQLPMKSYSLEIRIDSFNQILRNKEKVE